jgi:Domain of unknown function (DUF4136)
VRISSIFPLIVLAAVSGCAASIPPVEVTRFHLGQAIAPSATSVEPLTGSDAQSLEFRTYAAAVTRELSRLGFGGEAAPLYIAQIEFYRTSRVDPVQHSPVTIGIGGGSFGSHVGIGVGTSFGIGGNGQKETLVSRLAVRLKRKSDGSVVWEGRAVTEAPVNAPAAQPGLAADKLAMALFKDFPGESGKTVVVP